MTSVSIEKQRKFFDSLAPTWREKHGLSFEQIESFFSAVSFPENARVLDVGCGAGVIDSFLSSVSLSVDAIDLSEKMIEKAKTLVSAPNVTFSVADFYSLQQNNAYDVIVCFDAYPHFTNKVLFAEKAHSLLRENGLLLILFDDDRKGIDSHHIGHDPDLSVGLLSTEEESEKIKNYFTPFFTEESPFYKLFLQKNPL